MLDMSENIKNLCKFLQSKYCRLLLLTGNSIKKSYFADCCAENIVCEKIRLSRELSKILLDIPIKQRAGKTTDFMYSFTNAFSPVYFSDIEILFDKGLGIDPLTLFKFIARNRITIVNWPGEYDFTDKKLFYAKDGCLEYYEQQTDDEIFCINEDGRTSFELDYIGGIL